MILIVLAALLSLSFLNYLIAYNVLYPPFLFSATWSLNLLALVISGDFFYPVLPEALLLYLVGAFFFSVGGLSGLYLNIKNSSVSILDEQQVTRVHRMLDIGLAAVIIGLPFYIMKQIQNINIVDYFVLAALREKSVEMSASSERSFNILNNFVILSTLVALAMHYHNDRTRARRVRTVLAIVVATLYGVFTGSKGWVLIFPTLAIISILSRKKVKISTIALAVGATLVSFGAGLLMTNFIYSDVVDPLATLRILSKTIQNYWLGGMVAFNRIIEAPESITAAQGLNRSILEIANGFGASFEVPSLHPEFTQVTISGDDTNAYTIYFSYYKDFGWYGVIFGMFALGMGLTWIYRYAIRNHPVAVYVFSTAAIGIIFSFNAEHFVLALNYYIKLVMVYYFIYHVVVRKYVWNSPAGYREGIG